MGKVGLHVIMKNRKELNAVLALGKQYDKETDPEKREALKKEIDARCEALKGKLQGAQKDVAAQEQAEAGTSEENVEAP